MTFSRSHFECRKVLKLEYFAAPRHYNPLATIFLFLVSANLHCRLLTVHVCNTQIFCSAYDESHFRVIIKRAHDFRHCRREGPIKRLSQRGVRLFRPPSPLLIALILAKLPEGWRATTEWIKTLNN